MSKVYSVICLVCLVAVCLYSNLALSQSVNTAGTDPDKLGELTDDASRAELFKFINDAAESQKPAASERTDLGIPFALLGPFVFPNDALVDSTTGHGRVDSTFGIDISHYTPSNLAFDRFKQWKIAFVYAKATQGVAFKDGKFSLFWKALDDVTPNERKVHRGAYHFLTAGDDATAQANTFLKFLASNGGLKPTDMPPVLDLEWDKSGQIRDRWAGHAPKEILESTLAWLNLVEAKTGRTPILYTARSWWRERSIPEAFFAQLAHFKIWIADYSKSSRGVESPAVPNSAAWALWQYSETAKLPPGFDQVVDANIYKAKEDQFYSDFGLAKFGQ